MRHPWRSLRGFSAASADAMSPRSLGWWLWESGGGWSVTTSAFSAPGGFVHSAPLSPLGITADSSPCALMTVKQLRCVG